MLSTSHLVVVLGIVVLVFGTKKLRHIGEDLGNAIRGFKKGMKENNEEGNSENTEHTKVLGEIAKNQPKNQSAEEKNIN